MFFSEEFSEPSRNTALLSQNKQENERYTSPTIHDKMAYSEGDPTEYGLIQLARDEPIDRYIQGKALVANLSIIAGNSRSGAISAQSIYVGLENIPIGAYTPQRWVEDVLLDASASMDPDIIRTWRGHRLTSIQPNFHLTEIREGWRHRFGRIDIMNAPLWYIAEQNMGESIGYMLMYLLELVIVHDLQPSWRRAWSDGRFPELLERLWS